MPKNTALYTEHTNIKVMKMNKRYSMNVDLKKVDMYCLFALILHLNTFFRTRNEPVRLRIAEVQDEISVRGVTIAKDPNYRLRIVHQLENIQDIEAQEDADERENRLKQRRFDQLDLLRSVKHPVSPKVQSIRSISASEIGIMSTNSELRSNQGAFTQQSTS